VAFADYAWKLVGQPAFFLANILKNPRFEAPDDLRKTKPEYAVHVQLLPVGTPR